MKYYLDTEFIERPGSIELISLGIKCEDDRTLYAESTCFDERNANDWVMENILPKLRWYSATSYGKGFCNCATYDGKTEVFGTLILIRDAVIDFIGDDIPEFWGYYADYDWVVFCWLFGSMVDLPEKYPMYCKDLKQLADETEADSFSGPTKEHNALIDAIWNEQYHKHLLNSRKSKPLHKRKPHRKLIQFKDY